MDSFVFCIHLYSYCISSHVCGGGGGSNGICVQVLDGPEDVLRARSWNMGGGKLPSVCTGNQAQICEDNTLFTTKPSLWLLHSHSLSSMFSKFESPLLPVLRNHSLANVMAELWAHAHCMRIQISLHVGGERRWRYYVSWLQARHLTFTSKTHLDKCQSSIDYLIIGFFPLTTSAEKPSVSCWNAIPNEISPGCQ